MTVVEKEEGGPEPRRRLCRCVANPADNPNRGSTPLAGRIIYKT
jgi:hypothetical protein